MKLPIVQSPLFDILIPSANQTFKFRPYLVKEEKILLIAQESDDQKDIINAIKQIIQNTINDDFDLSKLTVFDIEYIFLKLRSKSVNNIITLSYIDNEDEKEYSFEVNLDDIEMTYDDTHKNIIQIDENIKIKMKYPSVNITESMGTISSQADLLMLLIKNSIDYIYDADTVYNINEVPEEELDEFLDSLSVGNFNDFRMFFETMPKLYHKIEYKNSKESDRSIELKSLKDFFSW